MELDDFKAHWNKLQDKTSQKISPDKLTQIIMNATDTISQLHSKSIYWEKTGKIIRSVMSYKGLLFYTG